jgi:hypothetical protein
MTSTRILAVAILAAVAVLGVSGSLRASELDALKAAGEIDALLAADWKKHNLRPNPPASDEVFVRRIYLDVGGRIPTAREATAFLTSQDPSKRAKLIDRLLAGEGYVQHMFNYWADILRLRANTQSGFNQFADQQHYANFVKQSLRANKPYDEFVRAMTAAPGKVWDNGGVGYYFRDQGMPLDNMAVTVRIFLGTRIECAQCHDHPFDKWTQKQFYEMAAFTYGVDTNQSHSPTLKGMLDIRTRQDKEMAKALQEKFKGHPEKLKLALSEWRNEQRYTVDSITSIRTPQVGTSTDYLPQRTLPFPKDYQYDDAKPYQRVLAATMLGKAVDLTGPDLLKAYGQWMTSPENPRFTTVIANRLWKKVFGLGLIEPVDDMKDSTVAVNPELMKQLEKLMVGVGYDLKAYLRVLYNTQAYQRSATRSEVVPGDAYRFTGPLLRRMTAEQIWDSFVTLTNVTPDMPAPRSPGRDSRYAHTRKISDGIDCLTPEELLKGLELAGELFRREGEPKIAEFRKQIEEAEAKGDKAKAKSLTREMRKFTGSVRERGLDDHVYVPAFEKLSLKVSGKVHRIPVPVSSKAEYPNSDRIKIPGYDVADKTPAELAAEREAQQKGLVKEADSFGIPANDRQAYTTYRGLVMRDWLRAAELDSPAPRGHYLREFGQSDRETVENANLTASIPQVHVLMNSDLVPKVLARFSALMLTVNQAPSTDAKVDAIYLTLLARKPTALEKQKWAKAQEKGLDLEDLIYALVNTQQFIFIQ